jgi:hypothetical protein
MRFSRRYRDYVALECDVMLFGRWVSKFRKNLPRPLPTLTMEVAGSSEMLVPVYYATRRHIPEDRIFNDEIKEGINS